MRRAAAVANSSRSSNDKRRKANEKSANCGRPFVISFLPVPGLEFAFAGSWNNDHRSDRQIGFSLVLASNWAFCSPFSSYRQCKRDLSACSRYAAPENEKNRIKTSNFSNIIESSSLENTYNVIFRRREKQKISSKKKRKKETTKEKNSAEIRNFRKRWKINIQNAIKVKTIRPRLHFFLFIEPTFINLRTSFVVSKIFILMLTLFAFLPNIFLFFVFTFVVQSDVRIYRWII